MRTDRAQPTGCNVMSNDIRSGSEDSNPDDLLTDDEVSARYRGRISVGTLRNWRALRVGPPFIKVGKAVLYRRGALQAWDKKNTVNCSAIA